jgi:hypothetical protein
MVLQICRDPAVPRSVWALTRVVPCVHLPELPEEFTLMQSEAPETELRIQIDATLKADIEIAATAAGQSVNAWIATALAAAVAHTLDALVASIQEAAAAKRAAIEEQRKRVDAKLEKALQDMLDRHTARKP